MNRVPHGNQPQWNQPHWIRSSTESKVDHSYYLCLGESLTKWIRLFSFEESFQTLMEASMFGQADTLNGVSSNIMCGQLAGIGKGDSQSCESWGNVLVFQSGIVVS